MFQVGNVIERNCSGISRRSVLQVGAIGSLGLALPEAVRAQVLSSDRGLSVLCVFLRGGVAQMDTFDMKPDAPLAPARGEFKPINTSADGIQVCELLPQFARQADKLVFLRGMSHTEGEHDNAMQWVLTGNPPSPGGRVFPNFGAVVGRYRPGPSLLPPAMHVGAPGLGNPMAPPAPPEHRGLGAGFMGASHTPFMVKDVEKLNEMDWLHPAADLGGRLDRRRDLMRRIDRMQQARECSGLTAHDAVYERAFSIVTSPEAKAAFNVESEPRALRERYGMHEFGQSCLLGRRLIEAGVRYVQVNWSAKGWEAITPKDDLFTRSTFDSHFGHFPWLRRQLPRLDPGLATLVADLHDRGLLQNTLLLVLTEFGRSAGINGDAGRDHWTKAFTILMGGAGLEGGRAVGQTDPNGQEVISGKFGPAELRNTVFKMCGLDTSVALRIAGIVEDSTEVIPGLSDRLSD